MSERLERIYARGLKSLDNSYDYKPTRTLSDLAMNVENATHDSDAGKVKNKRGKKKGAEE